WSRQPLEAFSMAFEDAQTELVLEFDDGLGYAGLRSMQNTRRLGEVEIASDGFAHEFELLQIHITNFKLYETHCLFLSAISIGRKQRYRARSQPGTAVFRSWQVP